jgi:hypothetical protein
MKESPHGQYTLRLSGRKVVCYYSDGFNVSGVRELIRGILTLTEDLDEWVLYQRPEPSAGIAHEAINEMMQGYLEFQKTGCLAVAILDRTIFVRAGIPYHPEQLTMQIKIDNDEELLLSWLEQN